MPVLHPGRVALARPSSGDGWVDLGDALGGVAMDVVSAQGEVEARSGPLLDRTPATAAGLPPIRYAWADVDVTLRVEARLDGERLRVRTFDDRLRNAVGPRAHARVRLRLEPAMVSAQDPSTED